MIKISEAIKQSFDRLDALKNPEPVLTGFDGLDKLTTGFHKGDLILLGARPAMGKTSFALTIARHLALVKNKRIAFFSLDLLSEELAFMMLSAEASVAYHRIIRGQLTDDKQKRLEKAGEALSKSEFYIDDTTVTVPEMQAELQKQKNVDLVVIDYLQMIDSDPLCRNKIISSLKTMAENLHVPVLVLSQLPRTVEYRPDHRPKISDLKLLFGVIKDDVDVVPDADVVLFLYRDYWYYNFLENNCYHSCSEKVDENAVECIVAKNRYGETGTILLKLDEEYLSFTSVD